MYWHTHTDLYCLIAGVLRRLKGESREQKHNELVTHIGQLHERHFRHTVECERLQKVAMDKLFWTKSPI